MFWHMPRPMPEHFPSRGTLQLDGRRLIGKCADLDHHSTGRWVVEAVGFGTAVLENCWSWSVKADVGKALMLLAHCDG